MEPPLLCGAGGGSSQPPNSTLGSSERLGLSLNPHVQCWATVSGCLGALQGAAIITAALGPMSPRAGSAGQHEGMVAGHPVHPMPAVLNVLFVIPWSLTRTQIYSPLPPTRVSDRRCGQLSSGPWTPARPNPQSVPYVSPGIHVGSCGWDRAEDLEKGGGPQSDRHGPSREQRER